LVKVEAPEIEGPKVLDKIDLSSIDSSTRPKKVIKKKPGQPAKAGASEELAEEEETKSEVKENLVEEPVSLAEREEGEVSTGTDEEESPNQVIDNIKAEKIEGPKILGKIELPPDSDTRPKPSEEKRKRKRIPIEKKAGGVFRGII